MVQYKRANLFKRQVHTAIFLQTYPEVVTDLIKRFGEENAIKSLQEVGSRTANVLSDYWTPKSKKIKNIIKEMYKKFWAGNPKVMIKKNQVVISDKKCILCSSGAHIEVFPLCLPISSFIENMLYILSIKRAFPFTKATGKTVQSKGSGAKFCEHIIELTKEAIIWKKE